MPKFYFTYGLEGHPFVGGWTVVEAPDMETAVKAFQVFYPDKIDTFLNCSDVYTEDKFKNTSMSGERGNFGKRCMEIIRIERTLVDE